MTIFEPHQRRYNPDGSIISNDGIDVNLSEYESRNLKDLLSIMNVFPDLIPYHGGDWVNQILNKLNNGFRFNEAARPNFKTKSYIFLPEEKIKEVKVTVSPVMTANNNYWNEKYQLITIAYFIEENTTPIIDREIYISQTTNGIANIVGKRNELIPGTYSYADYIIMKALKDEEFKQNEE